MAPSEFPALPIPESNIYDFLFNRPPKPFNNTQVLFRHPTSDRHYTFTSLKRTARSFSAALSTTYDFSKGDVLALFTTNSIDVPAIAFGSLRIGGIVSPANPAYTVPELVFHLRDSSAKVVITTAALLATALAAANAVSLPAERILLIGSEEDGTASLPSGVRNWQDILRLGQPAGKTKEVTVTSQDLAFLVYSSGTTGVPKGVELTHRNIISNTLMVSWAEGENLTQGRQGLKSGRDKILSVLPQYHIYGLQCLIHAGVYMGVEVIVPPAFTLPSFLEVVQRFGISYAYVAPPIVLHLAKNPTVANFDLSSLRFLTSGAAPLTKELIHQVYDRLKIPVKQAYGLSETSPVTHIQLWDDSWKSKIGSVGPSLPGLATRFIDADGKDVPTRSEGELLIRGPTVFRGYHKNDDATTACKTTDGQGEWFKTGDIGFEDDQGNLWITDRVKELIKYKGSQVAPAELEGFLLGHEVVEDVAVLGRWVEDMHSEVPCAFVVLREGVARSEDVGREIVEWLASTTAKSKWLRGGVAFTDEIPKSGSGKILRRVLKEQLMKGSVKFLAEKLHAGEPKL